MAKRTRGNPNPNTTYDRYPVEPNASQPYNDYMFSRPVADFRYDVQWPTGYSVSSVPSAGWTRGDIVRQYQPTIHPPMLGYFTYNPTDPSTWHQSQH